MYRFEFSGKAFEFYTDYFTDGILIVKVSGVNNVTCNVIVEVLESSNLGPLLFIIYINDLIVILKNSIVFYIDDTIIYGFNKEVREIHNCLNWLL